MPLFVFGCPMNTSFAVADMPEANSAIVVSLFVELLYWMSTNDQQHACSCSPSIYGRYTYQQWFRVDIDWSLRDVHSTHFTPQPNVQCSGLKRPLLFSHPVRLTMPVNILHLSDDDSLHLLGELDIKTLVRVRQVRRMERAHYSCPPQHTHTSHRSAEGCIRCLVLNSSG